MGKVKLLKERSTKVHRTTFSKGQEVRIIEGHFKGGTGKVMYEDLSGEIGVELPGGVQRIQKVALELLKVD